MSAATLRHNIVCRSLPFSLSLAIILYPRFSLPQEINTEQTYQIQTNVMNHQPNRISDANIGLTTIR